MAVTHSRGTEPPVVAIRTSLDDVFDWDRSGRGAGQVGLTLLFTRQMPQISAFSYLTVIIATMAAVVFGENLDSRDLIGSILIISSGIILTISN